MRWVAGNLLRDDIGALLAPGAAPVIAWSGWLGDNPFERDPRTWGPPGLAALQSSLEQLLGSGASLPSPLWLRPHARHVLCDAHRCAGFCAAWSSRGVSLALDPLALLEPEMVADATTHLERMFERLSPFTSAVVLPHTGPLAGTIGEMVGRTIPGVLRLAAPE